MGNRTMKEWVSSPVDEDDLDGTLTTWRRAARSAHDFVAGL